MEISVKNHKNFSLPVYIVPMLNGFPLGTGARGQKNLNDGATGPSKKSDDIFSRLDTLHQQDRQTDGRTLGDSKDCTYA